MATKDSLQIETLIQLSQQGDRDAFAQLCELKRERLLNEVRKKMDRRLSTRVDASDVVQEVFWDANRRFHEVSLGSVPLIAWLRFLCNQKLVDMHRRHIAADKRSVTLETNNKRGSCDLGSVARKLVANISSPSRQAHRNEMVERVKVMLTELSPLDREVVVMRHFNGMSNQEVCESLGLSTNAASNRYIRALKRLKKIFDSFDVGSTE